MSILSQLTQARAARDAAIEQVENGADVRFKELAYLGIKEAARHKSEITSDDAKAACGIDFNEPRVWGSIFMRAARDGLIERTERTKQSTSRTCHCREQRIWKSKIYEAPRPAASLFNVDPQHSYGTI